MDAPLNAPQSKFITAVGQYDGKRLNSPNDLFLTASGDLYFTDPAYGLERGARDPRKNFHTRGFIKWIRLERLHCLLIL
jgi:gluconolactonase